METGEYLTANVNKIHQPIGGEPVIVPNANNSENDNNTTGALQAAPLDTINLLRDLSEVGDRKTNFVEGISSSWEFGFGKAYFSAWKGLFVFLAACIVLLIGYLLEKRRRQYTLKHRSNNNAPGQWTLRTPLRGDVHFSDDFYKLLKKMLRRSDSDIQRIDVPKTIKTTVEKTGMIHFAYNQDKRPTKYLALVDMHAPENHRSKLYEMVLQELQENDAPLERYFYDGDIRICWNDKNPNGISLRNLQHKYSDHYLIIFGSNKNFINPNSGNLFNWMETFDAWRRKVILTPRPPLEWDTTEESLAKKFRILPAIPVGFAQIVDTLEMVEPEDYKWWKEMDSDFTGSVLMPKKLNPELLEAILEAELVDYKNGEKDDRLLKWVIGCALPPVLFWEWTLYVGDLLASPTEAFLNTQNLFKLTRLPWFVNGKIPEDARTLLLNIGEKKYPVWMSKIKFKWQYVLQMEENLPPVGSMAWQGHRIQLLISKLINNPARKQKRSIESELDALIGDDKIKDALLLRYLKERESPLDNVTSRRIKRYFFKKKGLFWRLRNWTWQLPIVLLVLFASLLVHYTEPVTTFKFDDYITALSFSSDSRTFIAANGQGNIGMCEINGDWIRGQNTSAEKLIEVGFSEDGKYLYTGTNNNEVIFWNNAGKSVLSIKIPSNRVVVDMAFSKDLSNILIGYYSGEVELWDVNAENSIIKFSGHGNAVNDVAFSPDEKYFATGSSDKTTKIWDKDGQLLNTLIGHNEAVNAVAFSADGSKVLTGSRDKTAKLWTTTGELLATYVGHKKEIKDVQIAPNGKTVLTTSDDNTAKLWNINGELIRTLSGHRHYIRNGSYSPDSEMVITGDNYGVVKIWQLGDEWGGI